jgi:chaperone modulatory protein CbpM
MTALCIEAFKPNLTDTIGFSDLAQACAMSIGDLQELVEFGALFPLETSNVETVFSITCVESLRSAGKLRRDYDLDLFVVVVVIDFIRRIEQLESKIKSLQLSSLRA